MGSRKRESAEKRKEEKKSKAIAELRNVPTSPRKMRLVIDLIRGMDVNKALDMLKHTSKHTAPKLEKLVMSAIANWQSKNEGKRLEDSNLVIKEAFVDVGRTLRRMRPAPQGRGYVIRKRSNHVTIIVDSLNSTDKVKKTVKETIES
jgi:large subunit ribosomal protein L22